MKHAQSHSPITTVEPPCWCLLIKHGGAAWRLIRALQPHILLERTSVCHKYVPGGRFIDGSFQQPAPLRMEGDPRFSTVLHGSQRSHGRAFLQTAANPLPPRSSLTDVVSFQDWLPSQLPHKNTISPLCVCLRSAPPPPLLSSTGPNPPLQIRLLFGETFEDAGASLGPLS